MSRAREFADLAGSADAGGLTGRNIVINGAMQVAQRSTSETGLGAAAGYFTLDRFNMSINAASAGRYTMSQSDVTDLEGFSNALKIQCTTADTSIAAGEVLILSQRVEGQNIQTLKSTSTSSRAFTISFYAKSNESRAISLEARFSNGTNRQAATVHTIGTSWARYTMTVAAASSIQIDNDNSNEMQINFFLHAGSDYTSGTIQGSSLGAADNTKRAAGIGSIFASTSNFIEITGLQMELGEQATPFEHRSLHDEQLRCFRYYYDARFGSNDGGAYSPGRDEQYGHVRACIAEFPVKMRATPTVSIQSSSANSMDRFGRGQEECFPKADNVHADHFQNIVKYTSSAQTTTANWTDSGLYINRGGYKADAEL
jgi:hypothetical protein